VSVEVAIPVDVFVSVDWLLVPVRLLAPNLALGSCLALCAGLARRVQCIYGCSPIPTKTRQHNDTKSRHTINMNTPRIAVKITPSSSRPLPFCVDRRVDAPWTLLKPYGALGLGPNWLTMYAFVHCGLWGQP